MANQIGWVSQDQDGQGYWVEDGRGGRHFNDQASAVAYAQSLSGMSPAAVGNAASQKKAAPTTSGAPQSGPAQAIQGNKDFNNGTPEQIAAWQQDGYTGALNEIYPDGFGGFIPIPPAQGIQEPGFLANAQRRDDANANNLESQLGGINSGLRDRFSALDASDQSAYDMLNDRLGAIQPLTAQQYASNPADVARQIDAYDMLTGIAGGANDAFSNPADVARQQQTYDMLLGAANGSLDAHTNPEDLARQKQAADKLWGLTDPEITAQERFIYEKQRQIEEQDRRGYVEAKMRDLANRGMLGSGHEIGANLGAQQITSQNRVLGDLGALSTAVQRSMDAMGQYTGLATNMRNASDLMTSGNMNRRGNAMQGAGAVAGDMRNASDRMTSGNMDRRTLGARGAADQSNAIRQAEDVVGMFNVNSVNTTNQFNNNQARGIAGDRFEGQRQINESAGGRAGQLAGNETAAATGVAGIRQDNGRSDDFRRIGANQTMNDDLWKGFAVEEDRRREEEANRQLEDAIRAGKPKGMFEKWGDDPLAALFQPGFGVFS